MLCGRPRGAAGRRRVGDGGSAARPHRRRDLAAGVARGEPDHARCRQAGALAYCRRLARSPSVVPGAGAVAIRLA